MSTLVVDTLTGKSTATTLTIGSTPVVSASANSLTIRGEGSNQTSIQQGLCKCWIKFDGSAGSIAAADSFNSSGLTDNGSGDYTIAFNNDFGNANYACGDGSVNADSSRITGLAGTSNAYAAGTAREIFQVTTNAESDGATADNPTVVRLTYFGDLA